MEIQFLFTIMEKVHTLITAFNKKHYAQHGGNSLYSRDIDY